MKTLQERMTSMSPYFRGIEVYNEALMVKVAYPTKWKAYPSDDDRIKITPSENDPNLIYYYADSKETTYDDIFDLIEQTIKTNQDIILKLELLKAKVTELKELFQVTPYEDLLNLQFIVNKKKKSTHTRRKKKQEAEIKEVEKIKNDKIETEEEEKTDD